ncbi:hypothetical protein Q8W40_05475 [Vibrio penaeicida]|uniref:hypothetical protein n=1 Tax=Vibrio penaeicida TaxID=104609 RepID=UPI0027372CC7|nr:hypothetical protein [Vibrio penaeicida]MDP2571621.1 hypothetical protein [Vibrio penaeicida]
MENSPSIRNLFTFIFSVDVGLETSDEIVLFERVLSEPIQRAEIEEELMKLFRDPSISWSMLLENDDYVVYPANDEEDARDYVVETLLNRVFPPKDGP